jgi:hypothetical protein
LNLGIGSIFRPGPDWRFGLSAKSPSILYLTDQWSTRMKAGLGSGNQQSEGPVEGKHSYRIITPYRLMGSAAYFIQKSGVISVEYRFKDHRTGQLLPSGNGSNGYDYATENGIISRTFLPGHELRLGAEWRLSPLYLRGGYVHRTALREGPGDQSGRRYSFGAGYRKDGYFLDLAYRWIDDAEQYRPIGPETGGSSRIVHRMRGMLITGGARF